MARNDIGEFVSVHRRQMFCWSQLIHGNWTTCRNWVSWWQNPMAVHSVLLVLYCVGPWEMALILEHNFKTYYWEYWFGHSQWNCSKVNAAELRKWKVSIGSGNGLLPSENKPLFEPMLTQFTRPQWVMRSADSESCSFIECYNSSVL